MDCKEAAQLASSRSSLTANPLIKSYLIFITRAEDAGAVDPAYAVRETVKSDLMIISTSI